VKTWDVVIIGAGIIGLTLAISLRKQGLRVLIVERGEPGREASHAAAGMLAPAGGETPAVLSSLAEASAQLYPEFVHELEDESRLKVDFREQGTILVSRHARFPSGAEVLSQDQLRSYDPELNLKLIPAGQFTAAFIHERSVDPRLLVAAAVKAAQHRGIDISSGSPVNALLVSGDRAVGVETDRTSYSAAAIVNCAGAWAGTLGPQRLPVHPVKGQMLAVVHGPQLRHVVRSEEAYIVPRGDGRLVIGSTLENDGFNKQVDVNTIRSIFHAAVELLPGLASSKQHEVWAGLRPGTEDGLPILGATSTRGYFVATGHYRDGILLAPVTAEVMTSVIVGQPTRCEIGKFSAARFA
jgi:glycine oxidase